MRRADREAGAANIIGCRVIRILSALYKTLSPGSSPHRSYRRWGGVTQALKFLGKWMTGQGLKLQ